MSRYHASRIQRRITTVPQLEALEQRQVLSDVTSLSPLPIPMLPATTVPVGQPRQTTTNVRPIIPPGNSAALSPIGSSLLGKLLALPPSNSSPSAGKTSPRAEGGALNLKLQVSAALPGLLSGQAGTTLSLGGSGNTLGLDLGVTAGASAGDATAANPSLLSLNLGVSANTTGVPSGSGGASGGANGGNGGLGLSFHLNLGGPNGGQTWSGPGQTSPPGDKNPPVPPLSVIPLLPASTSPFFGLSSPAVPQGGTAPSRQAIAPAQQAEEIQWEIDLENAQERTAAKQAEDAISENRSALTANQLAGRPRQTTPATPRRAASGGERDKAKGDPAAPLPEGAEDEDSAEDTPWLLWLGQRMGLDQIQPAALGPIVHFLPALFAEAETFDQCFEQLAELADRNGLSPTSWVLLGLAGVVACEVAQRYRRTDAHRETTPWVREEAAFV